MYRQTDLNIASKLGPISNNSTSDPVEKQVAFQSFLPKKLSLPVAKSFIWAIRAKGISIFITQ